MSTIKALDLDQRLEEAAKAAVCAVAGPDEPLRARTLRLLRTAAAPADQPGSSVRQFEALPAPREVFDELRTVPFLGLPGRRVVVIEQGDAFLREHGGQVATYVQRPSPTGMLILCMAQAPGGPKRPESSALDLIAEHGVVVDCATPPWADARRWVRRQAQRLGTKLTPAAVELLLEAAGPNVLALESELEKLALYREGEAVIAERDVVELVAEARSRSVFELGDALARRDAAQALRLCHQLLVRGERPEGVLAALGYQVRQMWQLKRMAAGGLTTSQLARALCAPRFAVERLCPVAKGLGERWLAERLALLAQADMELKTGAVRSGEEQLWLERLLARLCA